MGLLPTSYGPLPPRCRSETRWGIFRVRALSQVPGDLLAPGRQRVEFRLQLKPLVQRRPRGNGQCGLDRPRSAVGVWDWEAIFLVGAVKLRARSAPTSPSSSRRHSPTAPKARARRWSSSAVISPATSSATASGYDRSLHRAAARARRRAPSAELCSACEREREKQEADRPGARQHRRHVRRSPQYPGSACRRLIPKANGKLGPLGISQRSQNIQKNRCRTTVVSRFGETLAELPLTADQVVCLGRDQAAWNGPLRDPPPSWACRAKLCSAPSTRSSRQTGRSGDRPRPKPGLRFHQAIRRAREALQRRRPRYDGQTLHPETAAVFHP
jgi:hypothetical protein